MNTSSPFPFLDAALVSIATRLQPPEWFQAECQQRLVLVLTHVLMQEKEAQSRLQRQQGRVVHVRWGKVCLELLITPAGLTDRASPARKPDLSLFLEADSPWVMAQSLIDGTRPAVRIEGDVQLAAELAWLSDNLRWDIEEDLARVLGDVPAHALADAGRRLLSGLRDLLAKAPRPAAGTAAAPVHGAFDTGVRAGT